MALRAEPQAGVMIKTLKKKIPTFGPGGIKTEEKLGECHVRGKRGGIISQCGAVSREGEGGILSFSKGNLCDDEGHR